LISNMTMLLIPAVWKIQARPDIASAGANAALADRSSAL
jgi:hypothetical protein